MNARMPTLAACFICLCLTAVPAKADPSASVGIGAENSHGAPGQEVDILINLKGAVDLGALELTLVYDPAILEFKSMAAGALLKGTPVLEGKADVAGRLVIVLASLESAEGDGAIFKPRFHVLGKVGQKSPLNIEGASAWEGTSLSKIALSVEPGGFTVIGDTADVKKSVEDSSDKFPWLWILIGGGIVVVGGLYMLLRSKGTPKGN